jgi:hypothetical protein
VRFAILAALVLTAVFAAPSRAASGHRILVARVGQHDAFKITLTFPNGRPVRSLRPGTYTIVVHDYSTVHNFALGSPSEHRRIFTGSVPKVSTRRYTVRFRPGLYVYACSAHPQVMNGRFLVHV